jgi:hypothetical protein
MERRVVTAPKRKITIPPMISFLFNLSPFFVYGHSMNAPFIRFRQETLQLAAGRNGEATAP